MSPVEFVFPRNRSYEAMTRPRCLPLGFSFMQKSNEFLCAVPDIYVMYHP